MQRAMDESKIKIKFKIQCVAYTARTDKRTKRVFEDMNSAEYLKFYNDKSQPKDYYGKIRSSADLVILIRPDFKSDTSALSIFNGVKYSETAILIGQDFIFDRYTLLHELGHVLGCAHEEKAKIYVTPLIFTNHAYIQESGYCSIMADPVKRTCKPGLFYSNPEVVYNKEKAGSYRANNAIWINNNRLALSKVGNEFYSCINKNVFDLEFIEEMAFIKINAADFSQRFNNYPDWG